MTLLAAMLLAVTVQAGAGSTQSDAVYAPLRLYNGTWRVARKDAPKPDVLVNKCALLGIYYACAQDVNGKPGALIIFLPADKPGHYYVQNIMPEGRASGRSDLEIEGNEWTYSNRWNEGGKTTYYKTRNTFSDKDHIHFEQSESSDGKDWKVTMSGDESHVSSGSRN